MALLKTALRLEGLTWRPRGRGIAVRTACLVVAAIALLWVCRNGQSTVIVWVAFAGYVAAAAIWVRGQYAASLTTEWLWTPHWVFSLILTLLSGALFGVGWFLDNGSLFIGGLVGLFFCLGYLSMALRRPPKSPTGGHFRWWVSGFGILSTVALIGVLLLGSETWFRLLVLAALLVPIPLAVLSGRAVTAMKNAELGGDATGAEAWVRENALWLGLTVGVVLVGVGTAVAVARVEGPWMWVFAGLLTLVVVALVSSTYADIAIIIAAIALLGITQPQQSEGAEVKLSAENKEVLVALGDSYMSGEGAKVYHEGTDNGGAEGNHCRRAPTAWAELAAERFEFDGFYSVACSGARTYHVSTAKPDKPNGAKDPESQFPAIGQQLADYTADQETHHFKPKLTVVSLGGNDAGFSTIGAMCLAPGNCEEEGERLWIPKLAEVEYQLRATFDQISETFEGVPVAVVGYPDPIYTPSVDDDAPPADCDHVPLSREDREFIEKLVVGLNAVVKDSAVDAGFYYVHEMAGSLAEAQLQLCDPRNDNRSGLNLIGIQSVTGEAKDRFNPKNWYHNSLHPNERGHVAMLTAFETWLDRHPQLLADIRGHPRGRALALADTDPDAPGDGAGTVDCQLYDVDESAQTCEDVGFTWIGSEVRDALLFDWWGLIYLVIGVGAWLLAVALFAWRMRVVANDPQGHPSDAC